jgi:tetratricopeptide (TPR) repeat protein
MRLRGDPSARATGNGRKRSGPVSDRTAKAGNARPVRRRKRPPVDVEREILKQGGRRGPWLLERLMGAATAYGQDRDREALNLVRPVRDAVPSAPSARELCGLAQYRLGNYRAAAKELEAFIALTDSVEQHPVLMDCYRAQRRWKRVDELWAELAEASPSSELVIEGRIVEAGSLADRGQLDDAIALLGRKGGDVKRAKPHHLRLWYALADLEERAGNLARARELFSRVRAHEADFADVQSRCATLG